MISPKGAGARRRAQRTALSRAALRLTVGTAAERGRRSRPGHDQRPRSVSQRGSAVGWSRQRWPNSVAAHGGAGYGSAQSATEGCAMTIERELEQLDAMLSELAAVDRFSGAVAVSRAGEPVLAAAYGLASRGWQVPCTVDTRFDTAS